MSRMTRTLSAFALALLVGCQPNPPTETATALPDVRRLQIDVTLETVPFLERLAVGARERWPVIDIQTQTVSHTVLMRRIAQGEVPYGLTLHAPDDKTLWSAPLAYDGMVVLVNDSSAVSSLSPHDLRRIYTGLTSTWETGEPITVFSWESGSGLRAEFERLVMGQRRLVTTAQILPTAAAVQAQIAQTPNSIAYLPYSQWQPEAGGRSVAIDGIEPTRETLTSGQYPLRLTVYLVGQTVPTGAYADFLAWMQSKSRQDSLAPAYIPLIP
jgi:phosphate transport system substrate-binding protein